MAYRSLIQNDWHAEAFRVGNAYKVVTNVGCDLLLQRTYSIAVGLDPLPSGELEYYFYIVDLDEITDDMHHFYSGRDTKNILPDVQRGAILRAILHATKSLLSQVNPAKVNWCTWDTHLPDKAKSKFRDIVRVFETSGYKVQEGEPHNGRNLWYAERVGPPSFPFTTEGEQK